MKARDRTQPKKEWGGRETDCCTRHCPCRPCWHPHDMRTRSEETPRMECASRWNHGCPTILPAPQHVAKGPRSRTCARCGLPLPQTALTPEQATRLVDAYNALLGGTEHTVTVPVDHNWSYEITYTHQPARVVVMVMEKGARLGLWSLTYQSGDTIVSMPTHLTGKEGVERGQRVIELLRAATLLLFPRREAY